MTIKTWREIKVLSNNQWHDEDCMKAEIAELRSALKAQPEIDELRVDQMTEKTYAGKEFAPIFYRALADWYAKGRVGANPALLWEYKETKLSEWQSRGTKYPMFNATEYRWKARAKRKVTIGYQNESELWIEKSLVAPETVAPKVGSTYYRLNASSCVWNGVHADYLAMWNGEVFLTKEDTQAMSDWLLVCKTGGAT